MTRELNLPGSTATEDQFHIAVAELLETVLRMPTFYTTFPAGYGRLSKATSGRLKKKGMRAGMPDILIFQPVSPSHPRRTSVIGLELKVRGNSLSAAQRNTHALLQAVGVRTYLIRSLHDVLEALRDAAIPFRSVVLQDRIGTQPQQVICP
jgi:hypothetical protein